ncbi:MAG TPA: adenosylcobinamide amidohydrolase [Sulfolobales archaeon]|nr:adenosylcobinamide amidohydrolase [Sulfolobales archaeon]
MLLRPRMVDRDTLVVDLAEPLRSLGTTVYGGGFRSIESVIFKHVDECMGDPISYAQGVAERLGRPASAVFLTAANVGEYIYATRSNKNLVVEAIATIGLTHPACIGSEREERELGGVGTINIFLAINAGLSDIGLIDLFRSVSEAKAGLIALLGLSCGGSVAVGTVSDATVVASREGLERYAGLGTEVGHLAAMAILEILRSHMGRRGPRDYIRYMGYREDQRGRDQVLDVIGKRVLLLLNQISGVRLIPWISGDHFRKIYARIEEALKSLGDDYGKEV